ncbi:MAG: NADH-quinone oxidoreductase subunit C [Bacteroidales bacterium]|jgi:NADH-quinone oxidoreductase subunit C|nr:NADH-quinone oxidoreductase subunit C [Bacteroidales bacterium]
MNTDEILKNIKDKFGSDVLEVFKKWETRANITIKPVSLVQIAEYVFKDLEFRFIIATANHTKKGFEILYHFSKDNIGLIANLHVILPVEKPEIESLTCLLSGANWIEREMHELYGIVFLNHPEPEKLISEGNWAEGVYPYRREFK